MKLFLICCTSKVRDNQNDPDLTTNAKENEMSERQSRRQKRDRKGACKFFGIFFILLFAFTTFAQKPELVVQSGHFGGVRSIAFSPDQTLLISGAGDGTIKLWDVEKAIELRTFSGHSNSVVSVAFSPDGKFIASTSGDMTVKLWDVMTGKEIHTFKGHTDEMKAVAFSLDGKFLASGSDDKTVRLWNIESKTEVFTFNSKGYIDALVFSPDGKSLFFNSGEIIYQLDLAGRKIIREFVGHSQVIICLSITPDGKILASGSFDNTIKFWDTSSGKETHTLKGHTDWIEAISFGFDGKVFASIGNDNTLKFWNPKDGKLINSIEIRGINNSMAFNTKWGLLAVCVWDSITIYDLSSGQILRNFEGLIARLETLAFSPDGKYLAVGGDDARIRFWDLQNGNVSQVIKTNDEYIGNMVFSGDSKFVAAGGGDGNVRIWDVASGKLTREFKDEFKKESKVSFVQAIAISPDGKILAGVGNDELINLWEIASGKLLTTIDAGDKENYTSISILTYSYDGKFLACGDYNGYVKIWDSASGKNLRTLKGHENTIVDLMFSKDGRALRSGSSDKVVKFWDLESGKEVKQDEGYYSIVNNMVVSPNQKTIASVVQDVKVKLWDFETGKEIANLIVFGEKDWVVITPEGLFDGAPDGQHYLNFIVGLEPIALEQLKERYYEPNLLQKLFGYNKEPIRNVKAFDDIKLFPKVEYQPPDSKSTKMTINLTNRGGGIGRVQVFVNGKEFIADARLKGFNPKSQTATFTVDLKESSFIAGAKNSIGVIAWNYDDATKEGYISSRGDEVVWAGEGEEDKDPPELYAIIGGVSDYTGDALDLRFAAKDAESFAKALEVGSKKFFGTDKVHIKLLTTNSTDPNQKPTKENFRKAFEEFRKAKPTDIFIVYLAGHGVTLQRGSDLYLYLTQEARTTDKSALADDGLRNSSTISSEELVDWIKLVPALKQAMILDTCAAGAAVAKLTEKRDVSGDAIRAIDRLKDRTNFYVLMGSSSDAVSYEASQYGQGLLTYSLLSAMKGARLREGQYADVNELFQYAADTVPELAKNIGGIQRPIVAVPTRAGYENSSLTAGSFDIGIFTKTEQAQIPLESPKPLILRPRLQNRDLLYDDLELEPVLQKTLRQKSSITERGNAEMIYVDADEMADAIRVSGNYVVEGDTVKVTLVLLRNNKPIVSPITITGTKANKDELIKKIVETVSQYAKGT